MTSSQPVLRIYSAGNSETLPGTVVLDSSKPDLTSTDAAANRVRGHLATIIDFFQTAYQRNSTDGRGADVTATVHYGRDYANVFWNGTQLVIGDGDQATDFTGSLSAIAHEYVEGLIQDTAAFEHAGQSGALIESLGAVFGVLVEQYQLKQSTDQADWLEGKGLFRNNPAAAIRSLKTPADYNQPDHMDDYDDHADVRTNSGIPNHAFYLLATDLGGNAWEKAGGIWYKALTNYATQSTDFSGFAKATIAAATDLFDQDTAARVKAAWSTVGVS
ncbi:M4 family metallopeptidase [Kitasatospora cineracea]|uniref:M4 family metallopeptidase n=1 Tax=Kitasatospora cineracea TaxID=88074 RepID=UPI0033F56B6D